MSMLSKTLMKNDEDNVSFQRFIASKASKKNVSAKLSALIIYFALVIIGFLAIPMCVFLGAIIIIWSIADKIVRWLER